LLLGLFYKVDMDKLMSSKIWILLSPFLQVLSIFQRLGMWLRKKRKKERFNLYVVGYGGITVGGVGKTPAVIERAELEIGRGKKVCVISRGYKGKNFYGTVKGINKGENIFLEFYSKDGKKIEGRSVSVSEASRIIGDELTLILWRLPLITVFKDKDRIRALSIAEKLGFDLAILDDAFQYVMVEKDEDIVLINALNPWGNGRIFPAGILREPLSSLDRATEVWVTNSSFVSKDKLYEIVNRLRCFLSENKLVKFKSYKPVGWVNWKTKEVLSLDKFNGATVDLYCAIGNPDSFFKMIDTLGVKVRNRFTLRDHALFPSGIIKGDVPILTTEKNILSLESEYPEVYALRVELVDCNLDD